MWCSKYVYKNKIQWIWLDPNKKKNLNLLPIHAISPNILHTYTLYNTFLFTRKHFQHSVTSTMQCQQKYILVVERFNLLYFVNFCNQPTWSFLMLFQFWKHIVILSLNRTRVHFCNSLFHWLYHQPFCRP